MKNWFKDVGFIVFVIPILGYFLSYYSYLQKLDYYNIRLEGEAFNIFDNLVIFLFLIFLFLIFMPILFIKYQLINFYKNKFISVPIIFVMLWYLILIIFSKISTIKIINYGLLNILILAIVSVLIITIIIFNYSKTILEKYFFEEFKELIYEETNKSLINMKNTIDDSNIDIKKKTIRLKDEAKKIKYKNFHSNKEVKDILKLVKNKNIKYKDILKHIDEIIENNEKFKEKKLEIKVQNTLVFNQSKATIIVLIISLFIILLTSINYHSVINTNSYAIVNVSTQNDNILLNQAICDSKYDKLVVVHETSENIYLQCGAIDGQNLIINTSSYYVTNKANQIYYFRAFSDIEIHSN